MNVPVYHGDKKVKLFWESIDFKHSIYPFSHIK